MVLDCMHQHEFIHGLAGLRARHRGCVATIGSFDGVHLGHQAILARLCSIARSRGVPSLVVIFEPQPHEYFAKDSAPARLMRLREKVEALFAAGVERVLCLKFDEHLRGLTAQEFVQQILVDKLAVVHLEIGDDFRFGCDRGGDFALLQKMGASHGFTLDRAQTLTVNGERVSSTRIRDLLEQDRFHDAGRLLGAPYSISGRVIYGKQLGRHLGAPTANLGLGRYRCPVRGVYAVRVELMDAPGAEAQWHHGVANVGVRPTLKGPAKPLLEVHLLHFNGDLYGQWLRVVFCEKLRSEQKFSNLDLLKQQIQMDIEHGKRYFLR